MALGAQTADIIRMVVGQGMRLGLIGALALTRVMTSLLFGVGATDDLTFSLVAGVGLMAVLTPARRATGVDPIVAPGEE